MRQDKVHDEIARLADLTNYVHDGFVDMIDPGTNESIKIGSFGTITINDTFASSDGGAAKATENELVITVSKEKWSNVLVDPRQEAQNLNGRYIEDLALETMSELKATIDRDLLDYLGFGQDVSSGSSDTFNVAGDTLARTDWLAALASLASQKGSQRSRFVLVADPYAVGDILNLGTFKGYEGDGSGGNSEMGVRNVGLVDGVPLLESNGLPGSLNNQKTFSATFVSGAASSQYVTASVGTHHGLLAGMPVSLTNVDDPDSVLTGSSVFITKVDPLNSSRIVIPVSSSVTHQGSTTVDLEAAVNYLYDRKYVHFLPSIMFDPKFVDQTSTSGIALQMRALWGRGARSGFVKRILSPRQAL